MKAKKLILLILDGWGLGDHTKSDAVFQANTPCMDDLIKKYPNAQLKTSGLEVGLPEGQMGNSEVGHLNIGAGRIVYQELTRISKEINEGKFAQNIELLKCFNYCLQNNKPLHVMGLLSDGGVHSHQEHVFELIRLAEQSGLTQIYIHAFLDGRDTDPKRGIDSIKALNRVLIGKKTRLLSIIGRYYAMDRDHRWERVKKAYDVLIHRIGKSTLDFEQAIELSYQQNITDEFMEPYILEGSENQGIKEGDAVLCFNFRTDRCREITEVLTQKDFPNFNMEKRALFYVTMTKYDETFKNVHILYEKEDLKNTLGETIALVGKTQVRIAETEKYPHVTFFFSGGREQPFMNEKRMMINSPKVATYDLQPSMSAQEITDQVILEMKTNSPDFICINYANADMVGHTGVYPAIIQAVETVDHCLDQVIQTCISENYMALVIADHGNSDVAINPDGSPNTAHSTNPVPVVLVNAEATKIQNGILADVAPTILHLLDIPIPKDMTGTVLV